jgi:hypothetical protein
VELQENCKLHNMGLGLQKINAVKTIKFINKPYRRKIKIGKKIKVKKGNQNCNFIELEKATPFLLFHQGYL